MLPEKNSNSHYRPLKGVIMTQGKHAQARREQQNKSFPTMKTVNGAVATMAAIATLGAPMVAIADEPAEPQQPDTQTQQ